MPVLLNNWGLGGWDQVSRGNRGRGCGGTLSKDEGGISGALMEPDVCLEETGISAAVGQSCAAVGWAPAPETSTKLGEVERRGGAEGEATWEGGIAARAGVEEEEAG